MSFTGLIHAARLKDRFATHFVTTNQFLEDAANGELPTYSFIEPCLLHGHNDMHPPENALFPGIALDLPSSLLGGEALLAKIYNAVRSSSSSDRLERLQHPAHDQLRRARRHLRPRPPAAVPSPDPAGPAGQYGFTFDRSGIRVPAIAISPWIPERTVVNDEHRHTSLIRTLRERWSLGRTVHRPRRHRPRPRPGALPRRLPRPPEDWPDVTAQPVPAYDQSLLPLDKPLTTLQKGSIFALLALGKDLGHPVPDMPPDTPLTGARAMALIGDLFGHVFPNLTPI